MDWDTFLYRHRRLRALAAEDEGYQYYEECVELCRKKLLRIRKKKSAEFRQTLVFYEECLRTLADRLVTLACENMEFEDEEKGRRQ